MTIPILLLIVEVEYIPIYYGLLYHQRKVRYRLYNRGNELLPSLKLLIFLD